MKRHLISSSNDSQMCRICLDNDHPEDLIRPCLCSGESAYVHRNCLDNWRSSNTNGRSFKSCDICQFEYVIEPVIDHPQAEKQRLRLFRLHVIRDIIFIILLIQLILIGMTFILKHVDKTDHTIKDLYPSTMSSFTIYYLSSCILFLALLGLFGLIGLCCGMTDDNNNRSNYTRTRNSWVDFNNCNCNCDCDCKKDKSCTVLIVIIILIFAFIGVFVGIILSVIIGKKILKIHTEKIWLKQETKKYIVQNFEGKLDQLKNISNQRSNTTLTTNNRTNNHGIVIRQPTTVRYYQ